MTGAVTGAVIRAWSRVRQRPLGLAAVAALSIGAVLLAARTATLLVHLAFAPSSGTALLEGWMTPRYIAHLRDVSPEILQRVLDLPAGAGRRVTLADLAAERGEPLDRFLERLDVALATARSAP